MFLSNLYFLNANTYQLKLSSLAAYFLTFSLLKIICLVNLQMPYLQDCSTITSSPMFTDLIIDWWVYYRVPVRTDYNKSTRDWYSYFLCTLCVKNSQKWDCCPQRTLIIQFPMDIAFTCKRLIKRHYCHKIFTYIINLLTKFYFLDYGMLS